MFYSYVLTFIFCVIPFFIGFACVFFLLKNALGFFSGSATAVHAPSTAGFKTARRIKISATASVIYPADSNFQMSVSPTARPFQQRCGFGFKPSTLLLIALLSAFSFILYFPLSNNGLHYLESNNLFSSCQINQAQELARHQNDAVRFITLQQASRSCHMGFLVLGAMG